MSWTLAGVTIHPDDKQYRRSKQANYAMQDVLDAVVEEISFYGAKSLRVPLNFTIFGDENGGTGLDTLETAVDTDSDVTLVSDQGTVGSFRILSLDSVRVQALNHTGETWQVAAQLIKV